MGPSPLSQSQVHTEGSCGLRPNRLHTHTHPPKRLAHPRSPIPPLSTLTSSATHAHPTSPSSTCFCAIWGCNSSSSSCGLRHWRCSWERLEARAGFRLWACSNDEWVVALGCGYVSGNNRKAKAKKKSVFIPPEGPSRDISAHSTSSGL